MATQNSYPKPFVRSVDCYQPRQLAGSLDGHRQKMETNQHQVPQIMVNNRQQMNNLQYEPAQGPTSTVHKSMVHSRQSVNVGPGNNQPMHASAAYSRLISPTISQGSLSPQSIQPEFVQHRNQQQQHQHSTDGSSSWTASASPSATKPLVYSPSQQKHHESQQQFDQHQYIDQHLQQQQQPITRNEIVQENDSAQDYRQLLARISPSSPRNQASNVLVPDDKRIGYMHDKQIEQLSIAHQTYRTTPIVLPKPKARHDLAVGSYMHLNQDPTWDLLEHGSKQTSDQANKFQQALSMGSHKSNSPNHGDMLNTLPRSAPNYSNDVTGFIGARAAKLSNMQPSHPVSGSRQHDSGQNSVPVFDYREYIESTRHAR